MSFEVKHFILKPFKQKKKRKTSTAICSCIIQIHVHVNVKNSSQKGLNKC